jgi:hypothetical protein
VKRTHTGTNVNEIWIDGSKQPVPTELQIDHVSFQGLHSRYKEFQKDKRIEAHIGKDES